jgi:hypothetical protein
MTIKHQISSGTCALAVTAHFVEKLYAVYSSRTTTGNQNVRKCDGFGLFLFAAACAPISAMRFSVRLRTANFSISIFPCDIDSGRGGCFFAISGLEQWNKDEA